MSTTDLTVSSADVTLPVPADAPAPPEPAVEDPPPVCELIREISDGRRKAEDLDPATRQECVLALSLDGFSNDEIACLLRVSERTVTRDRKAARKTHGIKPDCELGDELLGELHGYVMTSIRRLSRLCNNSSTPPAVRVRADEAIGRMYQRFAEMVRRFSYAQDGTERLASQALGPNPMLSLPPDASYDDRLDAFFNKGGYKHL